MTVLNFFTDPALIFLRHAIIAGVLSSILFGILGAIVTVRRISGLAGAISHAVLGGIGLSMFFASKGKLLFLTPVTGAVLFALIAGIVIGVVSRKAKQREDTVINAIWAIGMSIGVLFLAKTPGYVDPMSYLFGNILLISESDLILLAILDVIVIFISWRFYPQIVASSFDEEFARVRGVNTDLIFFVILGITAISVVLLQTVVGIVMIIAMLTLPSGSASYIARSLATMILLGILFSLAFIMAGIFASWQTDTPAGAMTVVIAGGFFLLFSVAKNIFNRLRKFL